MAAELGFAVTVIDPRPAYATKERFPAAETVLVAAPGVLARRGPADGRAAAVVMTHHYVHDGPFLRWLLERPPAYIGLLGQAAGGKTLTDLAAGGLEITPVARARLTRRRPRPRSADTGDRGAGHPRGSAGGAGRPRRAAVARPNPSHP